MREPIETDTPAEASRSLANVVREVKSAFADRDDVVIDIREGQLSRLEVLVEELRPVFDDVPTDDARFDFAISSGAQPRLWIDAVSHVTMGRDRRTYRFLRDTRLGRVVLAESIDINQVADQVTRYIAERMIERERHMEGDVIQVLPSGSVADDRKRKRRGSRSGTFWRAVGVLLLGAICGVALTLALAWERLAELGLVF